MREVRCPYCGGPAYSVNGAELYPNMPAIADKLFWKCSPCYAWVGCHPNGDAPMGQLANQALRHARRDAHYWFDKIWKSGKLERSAAYQWLAYEMGIGRQECHIGQFDIAACRAVIRICRRREELEND